MLISILICLLVESSEKYLGCYVGLSSVNNMFEIV